MRGNMRKVSGFVLWVLFGLAVVIVPIACATDNTGDAGSTGGTGGTSGHVDMAGKADSMTKT
jgi:hypothetical protein